MGSKESTGTALATKEQRRLEALETIVASGLAGLADAGVALREIRDAKLYRASHSTFEAYCSEAWGLHRSYAYRLIDSSSISEVLSPIGDKPPSESVARELAPLASEPSKMLEAWARATETHGAKPTAAQVRAIVRQDAPEPPAAPAPLKAIEAAREPLKSPATIASFSRAFSAALADGWSLEDIASVMERIIRERTT